MAFPKLKRWQLITGGVILLLVILIAARSRPRPPQREVVTVQADELVQTVSVTGRVEPAESVELAFERSGRVTFVGADVGSRVRTGTVLARLDAGTLPAQLRQAQAQAEAERIRLTELERGKRPEEITAASTRVANAERALLDASAHLEDVRWQAPLDLARVVADAVTDAQEAVTKAKRSLVELSDIQYARFSGDDQVSIRLADAKAQAIVALYAVAGAGRWTATAVSGLGGGVSQRALAADPATTDATIATALVSQLSDALRALRFALDAVPVTDQLTATEQSTLATEQNTANTSIANLSAALQAIRVQTQAGASAITSAERSRNDAYSALAVTRDDLALVRAGTRPEQVAVQAAQVRSALANIQSIQAQLGQTTLRAPLAGIVTHRAIRRGEIAAATATAFSLISDAAFQIEANVPEADIAKLKLGDVASTTLDAYGSDVVFTAKITAIDPAETVVENVPTYRIEAQFSAQDARIKAGMTANLDILTERKSGVLVLPQRAIRTDDGKKFALRLAGETEEKVAIETGLRGSDGRVEIVSGLAAGDQIVVPE